MASGGTIATRYIQIVPSAEGIKGSIASLVGGEAESAGNTAGEGLGRNLVGKITSIIAAAGLGKALSSALSAGADLQQSFGGLETIYDTDVTKASDSMKKLAREASGYGIDMNTYAEQAVGMGAALRAAFGGDTQKAAKSADTAIKDMADNAAKMGSDVGSLQVAYAGFAKQNYTMLDNLKLGYGGTKEEMQRLLSDAEKLSGVKYDINNLGDVYDAIHVIQEDLGLTGVAADEAKTTFSGSFEAMKASATNFLADLSTGGDVTSSMTTLLSSVVTFISGNAIPMIMNVLRGIGPAISTVISEVGPSLMTSGIEMINNLANGVAEGIPQLLEKALPMLEQLTANLRENAGTLIDAGLNLVVKIAEGIAKGIPTLVSHVPQIIINIAGIINDNLPKILATGVKIVVTIAKGLIQAIPTIVSNIPKIIQAIVAVWQAFSWVKVGQFVMNGIKNGFTALIGALKSSGTNAVTNLKSAFTSINWSSVGSAIINGIKNGLSAAAGALFSAAKSIASKVLSSAKSALGIHSPSKLFKDQVGRNITLGMAEGIEAEAGSMEGAIASLSNRSIDAVGYTDITSPGSSSTLLSEIKKSNDEVVNAIKNLKIYLDSGAIVGATADMMDYRLGKLAYVGKG